MDWQRVVEQAPQLAVLAFVVIQFMRHISRSQRAYESLVERTERVIARNTGALEAANMAMYESRQAIQAHNRVLEDLARAKETER
jgi:hypothetical protein